VASGGALGSARLLGLSLAALRSSGCGLRSARSLLRCLLPRRAALCRLDDLRQRRRLVDE